MLGLRPLLPNVGEAAELSWLGRRDADADENNECRDHDDPRILFHEGHCCALQVEFGCWVRVSLFGVGRGSGLGRRDADADENDEC